MSDEANQIRTIISILNMMNNSPNDTVGLFKTAYLKYFDVNQVPPVSIHADKIIYINKEKATTYLKQKYNLIPTEELCLPSKK